MNNDNVAAVRNAYAVAERKDLKGWINLFTPDGVFVDNSVGVTYRGRALAEPVRNYGTAFSNMHRELHRIYVDGNVVVVQLALQGTHDGPRQLPFGELPATVSKWTPRAATCSNSRGQDQTLRLLPRGVDHLCSARGLEQPRRRFESLRIRGCPLQRHQPAMPSS
jgi:SnoaL-like protein